MQKAVCTAFSKALSLAIAVAIGPEGEANDIMGEVGRDSLGTATVEAAHSAIVEVKQLSDDNVRESLQKKLQIQFLLEFVQQNL